MYFAPDPSSQIACTIGGNVAENSGGVHCLKYGLTVHNILALRAYTIDGDLLEIGGDTLDAAGYDLLALVTGSEGLLCVTTEVTVRLLPMPVKARVVLAACREGDTLRTQLAVLRRFAKREPVDTIALRRQVADVVQDVDRYPFEGR